MMDSIIHIVKRGESKMKITTEIKKTFSQANLEVVRNEYQEDSPYGEKAGDVFWTIAGTGEDCDRSCSDPYKIKWQAVQDAVTTAVSQLREQGAEIDPKVSKLADEIKALYN
tara:strand:- start:68 stop:403 length:336 start_codon:yes stop_codon:yes gene_type:complete